MDCANIVFVDMGGGLTLSWCHSGWSLTSGGNIFYKDWVTCFEFIDYGDRYEYWAWPYPDAPCTVFQTLAEVVEAIRKCADEAGPI